MPPFTTDSNSLSAHDKPLFLAAQTHAEYEQLGCVLCGTNGDTSFWPHNYSIHYVTMSRKPMLGENAIND